MRPPDSHGEAEIPHQRQGLPACQVIRGGLDLHDKIRRRHRGWQLNAEWVPFPPLTLTNGGEEKGSSHPNRVKSVKVGGVTDPKIQEQELNKTDRHGKQGSTWILRLRWILEMSCQRRLLIGVKPDLSLLSPTFVNFIGLGSSLLLNIFVFFLFLSSFLPFLSMSVNWSLAAEMVVGRPPPSPPSLRPTEVPATAAPNIQTAHCFHYHPQGQCVSHKPIRWDGDRREGASRVVGSSDLNVDPGPGSLGNLAAGQSTARG
ncbi:hypothetical protein V8F33_004607 [Rhypophila sp. PSN 637]